MSKRFLKQLALALLVIFMTNTAVWSVHSNWLAHELEHIGSLKPMALAANHVVAYDSTTAIDSDKNAPTTIEHQLLHATDHIQLLPSPNINGLFVSVLTLERPYFTPINVPFATLEAPFRPPRITPLI